MSEQNVSLDEAFGGAEAVAPLPEAPAAVEDEGMNVSLDEAFGEKPSPVATGQEMLQRKPAGPDFGAVSAPTGPAIAKKYFDIMQRPAAAVGAFMSEQEDARMEGLTTGQSIQKGLEAAWARFKSSKIPTLSVGELFEKQMLQEGAVPSAASVAGTLTNMALESVTDPSNLIGPVYRQAVKAGLASKPFLDDVIKYATQLKKVKAEKEAVKSVGKITTADPVTGTLRQVDKPTAFNRFVSAFLGVRPENVVMYGQHADAVENARPLTEIGDELQVYFDDLADQYNTVRLDYAAHASKAQGARQKHREILRYKSSPQTNSGVIKSAVNDLEDKVKGLSSAGFDALDESDASIPVSDVLNAGRNFQAAVMGQTADMADPIPITREQSRIMADIQRLGKGLLARYPDGSIPLKDLKYLLKEELPFDKYRKVTGGYNFPSAIQRAWRKDFHGYLNGKLKEVAPKEYSDLMQEAHEISQFLEKNSDLLSEDRIPTALSKYASFVSETGAKPKRESAVFDALAKLSGRDDITSAITDMDSAIRNLADDIAFEKLIQSDPDIIQEKSLAEAIKTFEEWRTKFPTFQRGARSGEQFVKRISGVLPENLTVNDKKTLAAINMVLSEEAGRPVNVYQELLDRKVLDGLSVGARADTQSARRTLGVGGAGGTLGGLGLMGGIMDAQTAGLLTAAGLTSGFILDRYGPVVAKAYAAAAYDAPKAAVSIGKTGVKMMDVMGNLDKVLGTPFAYGYIDQLVNPNSALHKDGSATITDPQVLSFIQTEVMKSKNISNKDRAKIINDIREGRLELKSEGLPEMKPTQVEVPETPELRQINEILKREFQKPKDQAAVGEPLGPPGDTTIPWLKGMKDLADQYLTENIVEPMARHGEGWGDVGAAMATPFGVATEMLPGSYEEFAPGLAALPPWVKNKSGAISLKKAAKALGRDIKAAGELEKAADILPMKPMEDIASDLNKFYGDRKPEKTRDFIWKNFAREYGSDVEVGERLTIDGKMYEVLGIQGKDAEMRELGKVDPNFLKPKLSTVNENTQIEPVRTIKNAIADLTDKEGNIGLRTLWGSKLKSADLDKYGFTKAKNGEYGITAKVGSLDPFAWMDTKYGNAKKVLEDEAGKKLNIYTRSDLIAHDDYIEAIDPKHTVNLIIPGYNDRVHRVLSGADPSGKRMLNAAKKLKESGVNVKIIVNKVEGIPTDPDRIKAIEALGLPVSGQMNSPSEEQRNLIKEVLGDYLRDLKGVE